MSSVIVSWDNEAKLLYRIIGETHLINYVVERDHDYWGSDKNHPEIAVVSFGKAYSLYKSKKIDKWIIPCMRGINIFTGIYLPLIKRGVREEDVLYAPLRFFKDTTLSDEERRKLIIPFKHRTDLDFLVLHITEHCNLSCAQCSMFAGLVNEPKFMDFAKTEMAVRQLKNLFEQVLVIKLIGGEPLLNKEIGKYCRLLRSVFPLSDIEIATNGTLIRQLDSSTIDILQEESITLDIAYYSVLNDEIDDINEFLNSKNIKHYITREISVFSILYNLQGDSDIDLTYETCKMKFNCVNMKENKLAVCHVPFALPNAKAHFNLQYETEGYIDLFEEGLTAQSVIERLNKPSSLCRFCNRDLKTWQTLQLSEKEDISNWSL